jgi:outer membrane biosynthesis protein TonB
MLIVALVMAVIGLAALVTAVVTSNEVIAWVCIGASVIGVVLLIIDALRERQTRDATPAVGSADEEEPVEEQSSVEEQQFDAEYPEEEAEPVEAEPEPEPEPEPEATEEKSPER